MKETQGRSILTPDADEDSEGKHSLSATVAASR